MGALLVTLGLLAQPMAAVDVRLEVAPFVAVPLAPFLDSQASATTLELNGREFDATALVDVTNSTGGGISLSLLLDAWELRYAFAVLPYDRVKLTHVGLVINDLSIYLSADDLDIDASASASSLDAALFHVLGFGYRFEPFPEWVVSPYVPLFLGAAVVQPRNDADTMFGGHVEIGIGAHGRIGNFSVGLAVRYGVSVLKNPDTSIATLQRGATASLTTGSSAFDSAVEVLQTVGISLTLGMGL